MTSYINVNARRNRTHVGNEANRAMISVIEKARGRRESHMTSQLLSVALMAVFFVALMGGLAAGASLYRFAVEAQELSTELHMQAGLIANVVRNNDFAGAVSVGEGPEGPAIVLTRTLSSGSYETRIYHHEGKVMQETAVAGRPYDPANATALLETDVFEFTLEDGLLTITCDDGSFDVALRSTTPATAATRGGGA